MKNWEVPEQLFTADEKLLKLALDQTDARQKDLDTNSYNISSRVQTLLTVFVSIVVASIGFFLAHQSEGWPLGIVTIVTFLYSLALCWYLLTYAYTGRYMPVGGSPSNLFPPQLLAIQSEEVKLRSLYLSLLYTADERIKTNREENERRLRVIRRVINAAIGLPVLLIVLYGVAIYFASHPAVAPALRSCHWF